MAKIDVNRIIPLLAEEGRRDSRKADAPGWSVRPKDFRDLTTPSASSLRFDAASLEASPYRVRASRPPLRGGEYYATSASLESPNLVFAVDRRRIHATQFVRIGNENSEKDGKE